MHISVPCPSLVLRNSGVLRPLAPFVTIQGALLAFDIQDDQPLALIRKWDEELGIAIADEREAVLIMALSHLKAAVLDVEKAARRSLAYINAREENYLTRAADELSNEITAISHSHAERNASSDNSSEQHGAAPREEETLNEQAQQEGTGQ